MFILKIYSDKNIIKKHIYTYDIFELNIKSYNKKIRLKIFVTFMNRKNFT